jgi:hypothetical protein
VVGSGGGAAVGCSGPPARTRQPNVTAQRLERSFHTTRLW